MAANNQVFLNTSFTHSMADISTCDSKNWLASVSRLLAQIRGEEPDTWTTTIIGK